MLVNKGCSSLTLLMFLESLPIFSLKLELADFLFSKTPKL